MLLASFAYAQVIKHQRRSRLIDVEQRMIWGLPAEYFSRLKVTGLSGNINTSFVERANLTSGSAFQNKLVAPGVQPNLALSLLIICFGGWPIIISADTMKACASSLIYLNTERVNSAQGNIEKRLLPSLLE